MYCREFHGRPSHHDRRYSLMSKSNKTVSIAARPHQAALSKGQTAFNTLIKQIEKKRARLAAWESAMPPYHQKYLSDWVPLIEASADLRVKLVVCLDGAYDQKGFTKTERRTIAEVITELAGELVAARNDAEMKRIYNCYSQSDYDRNEAANLKGVQDMLEDALGLDLGDELDLSSPDEFFARAQEKIQDRQAEFAAERQAHEDRRTKRAKSAKQLAQEARQHTQQRQLSQSIREVYRKLVSALHPDRETDPAERDRKTALMQRVNQAYDKNNLLQLLELQLELEHIDQFALNSISEDRLKHYNKILKDQLAELEQEILHVEDQFRAQYGLPPFVDISPSAILRDLVRDIVTTQQSNRDIEHDLQMFNDIKMIKLWLKAIQRQSRMMEFDDPYFRAYPVVTQSK